MCEDAGVLSADNCCAGSAGIRFHEFNPIAKRIIDIHALETVERLVVADVDAEMSKMEDEVRKVLDQEGRMCFSGRPEVRIHTEVYLELSRLEPAPATRCEVARLRRFRDAERALVEVSGERFTTGRQCELNMVDRSHTHIATIERNRQPKPR